MFNHPYYGIKEELIIAATYAVMGEWTPQQRTLILNARASGKTTLHATYMKAVQKMGERAMLGHYANALQSVLPRTSDQLRSKIR